MKFPIEERMVLDISALENRIFKLVASVKKLKEENSALKANLSNLSQEKEDALSQVDSLKHKLGDAQLNQRDVQKEEAIRSKVVGLLEKLNDI